MNTRPQQVFAQPACKAQESCQSNSGHAYQGISSNRSCGASLVDLRMYEQTSCDCCDAHVCINTELEQRSPANDLLPASA
eukprot:3794838-Amphidinium_carterae.1